MHMSAVDYIEVFHSDVNGFLSLVRQTKSAEASLNFKLFLASVAASDKTPALPPFM